MTIAADSSQPASQTGRMISSTLRTSPDAIVPNQLVGRSVTEVSVLHNITQIATAGRPLERCSALEIGCASWVPLRHLIDLGIDYLGIDIRKSNVEKSIKFFGDKLPRNVRYDVRAGQDVSLERDGIFDVVFVIGLIYHLDIRDTYRILDAAKRMRRGAVVVDTPVWPSERTKIDYYKINGNIYSGCTFYELEDLTPEEMETLDHASYGSAKYPSFHFDKHCFRRFLHNLGFKAVTEYCYDTNAQDLWGRPYGIMFNVMDWPIMVCSGPHHDGEIAHPGIFQNIPERGPNQSIAPEDIGRVLDRIHAHLMAIGAERTVSLRDIDQLAEMVPVRLLPHMLLAMIELDLPFDLLMHSIRRYLIAPVRHGSPHDRAHALIVLLTMASRRGQSEPIWTADLVRGFLEVFFYAYRGERGGADPLDLLLKGWEIEPAPPLLSLLPGSTLGQTAALWRQTPAAIIRNVVDALPLADAQNRTKYRSQYAQF